MRTKSEACEVSLSCLHRAQVIVNLLSIVSPQWTVNTGLWLANSDHVTWTLASGWSVSAQWTKFCSWFMAPPGWPGSSSPSLSSVSTEQSRHSGEIIIFLFLATKTQLYMSKCLSMRGKLKILPHYKVAPPRFSMVSQRFSKVLNELACSETLIKAFLAPPGAQGVKIYNVCLSICESDSSNSLSQLS